MRSSGRRGTRIGGLICALFITLAPAAWANGAERAPFTVRDSIEMTRIVDPKFVPMALGDSGSPSPKWSPDSRHFFIVTMKGDLDRDLNRYSLRVFDAAAAAQALSAERAPSAASDSPESQGMAVAEFSTSSTRAGIDDARWLPGGQIAFIGRAADGFGQVYSYDLNTRALTKWTASPHDVVRFDLSIPRELVVYATDEAWTMPEADRKGYEVTSENAVYLQASIRRRATHYYVVKKAGSAALPLPLPPALSVFGTRQIYLSPDGRHAVTPLTLRHYPASWIGYDFVRILIDKGLLSHQRHAPDAGSDASPDDLVFTSFIGPDDSIGQFYLFDLDALTARPLLDGPTFIPGVAAVFYERAEAQWSDDGRRVLLSTTMLPLNGDSRRAGSVYVAEVDPETSAVSPVTETHRLPSGIDFAYTVPTPDAKWLAADRVSVGEKTYRRTRAEWRETRDRVAESPSRRELALSARVVQDMSSPPEVEVSDASGKHRKLTDLNPQFRAVEMGGVRVFEWRDRHGRAMSAGMVTPPGFESSRRYPVVIQLGRFHPGDFVVDGMGMFGTTAFAARALAGRGMLVVEPASLRPLPKTPGEHEGEMITELVEDLIEALDRAGTIDPMKVGVIGFSRTGMYAQHLAAFSKRPLAAVTVADSVAATPFCYAREYGLPAPSMTQFEAPWQMGAPFWSEGVAKWMERSDLFHLDRISAPIRYETNGEKVPCYWESFAILSRMGHPVEMIHLPLGEHLLVTPAMRFTSQEGNVDWFSFWLAGYMDSAIEKRDQYGRWQALRDRMGNQTVHGARDVR